MDVIGVIAEYNPFHNGHLYHIKEIKRMYPNSIIVAVISTSFLQRGEVSILNKWDKTRICLENGIDLVIELPFVFSSQSADVFSYGALKILNYLNVNKLVFGSESNDIKLLYNLAKEQLNNKSYDKKVKKYLDGIVKLCKDNNVELIFTELPSATSWNLSKSEVISKYAKENNIKFIDLNKEEIEGFDWKTDTCDGGDHLNVFGAEKVTRYLGKYLTSNYQFINHKSDTKYKQWIIDSKKYH